MKQLLWAHPEFRLDLQEELRRKNVEVLESWENLFVVLSDRLDFVWIESQALDASFHSFSSISQAQSILRQHGRLWTSAPVSHFRRSELITQELLQPKIRPRKFLEKIPQGALGIFCLTSENELWLSPQLIPALPLHAWKFEENREAPSRAYLKLWELFTREGFCPKPSEKCLELGSAPGGWTWVLRSLSTSVIAVDKGEMDSRLLEQKQVIWLQQDAFSIKPEEIGPVDWFFSDLICYPARLLEVVKEWSEKGLAQNFVCTLKFKGKTDFETLEAFLRLPGSKARHLHHNKHEVTWFWLKDS